MEWGYTLSGFAVGILVGLTGIGGGSLMTPLLIFVYGVAPITAVGTDLLFAAITKACGIVIHHRKSTVEWKIVRLMLAGSIPTALLVMGILALWKDQGQYINSLVTFVLGIALVLTSLAIVFKNMMHRLADFVEQRSSDWPRRQKQATVISGIVLGILVPISSVGAGALGTATLLFLYPRLPMRKIVGTDIAHAVSLTAIAGMGHLGMGSVDSVLLLALLLGSLPGIWLGSHLTSVVPEKVMRPILASMLMAIGLKFIAS